MTHNEWRNVIYKNKTKQNFGFVTLSFQLNIMKNHCKRFSGWMENNNIHQKTGINLMNKKKDSCQFSSVVNFLYYYLCFEFEFLRPDIANQPLIFIIILYSSLFFPSNKWTKRKKKEILFWKSVNHNIELGSALLFLLLLLCFCISHAIISLLLVPLFMCFLFFVFQHFPPTYSVLCAQYNTRTWCKIARWFSISSF